ncbi:MAG: type secretion system protein VirD4 [Actinomycetota bacterium]|jgi:type IV secretion system protein VirD4|nr:type secretion system protein VirD4 [Actinomycetota bacterium]
MKPSSQSVPAREQGWENLLFVAMLALFALGSVVWLTGQLAALATSRSWPDVSFSQMGRVVMRLADHIDDPAKAWPRPERKLLPGPVPIYLIFVLLMIGASALGLSLRRLVISISNPAGGSSWASIGDLRPLIVKRPIAGRLALGRVGRNLIAAEERQSVIVLGPTQSMKTSGFAIPAILEWQGPVLATSVKTDLLRNTIDARSSLGEAFVYDPTGCADVPSHGWSPLAFCNDWSGAQKTVSWLTEATTARTTGFGDSDFWYAAAAKLLQPVFLAASMSDRSMSDVVRWVNLQEEAEILQILKDAGEELALDAARASFKREVRQKSSVYTTAETVLAAYEDPVVASSAANCEITPSALLSGGRNTLYVVAPSHEQKRLRPLFETLIHSIISHAFERASSEGGSLKEPLLVVLDEAANIAPLRDLDTLASTASSHGIQLVSVFQDMAQITTRYQERAQTVVNNHRAKIVLSGISDTQTLEYASRLLGDEEVMHSSVTRGSQGTRSTTESMATRSVAPANVLRSIRPGEGILVYGHLPPTRLRLRPWFKEKLLRTRAA